MLFYYSNDISVDRDIYSILTPIITIIITGAIGKHQYYCYFVLMIMLLVASIFD